MSKTYFVVSDIHSFYTPLIESLRQVGYEKRNKDHILVVLGDIFDRGEETIKLYNYLRSIPKRRIVLVKGNHESLFLQLLKKDFPERHDFSNGTVSTFCHIANFEEDLLNINYQKAYARADIPGTSIWKEIEAEENRVRETWKIIRETVSNSDVTAWIRNRAIWKDYFELGQYIMTHAFLPVDYENMKLQKNWRETATKYAWEDCKWLCPWQYYRHGIFESEATSGKILVCGHWHTSDFYKNLEPNKTFIEVESCPIYRSEHLIALDACTILNNRVNVLVIKGEEINYEN